MSKLEMKLSEANTLREIGQMTKSEERFVMHIRTIALCSHSCSYLIVQFEFICGFGIQAQEESRGS